MPHDPLHARVKDYCEATRRYKSLVISPDFVSFTSQWMDANGKPVAGGAEDALGVALLPLDRPAAVHCDTEVEEAAPAGEGAEGAAAAPVAKVETAKPAPGATIYSAKVSWSLVHALGESLVPWLLHAMLLVASRQLSEGFEQRMRYRPVSICPAGAAAHRPGQQRH